MTNLQALYLVLKNVDLNDVILDNFLNQDESEYEVDGKLYIILDTNGVKELCKKQIQERVDVSKNILILTGYQDIESCIYWNDVVSDLVNDVEFDQIEGYLFINNIDDLYIFEVE